MRAKKRNKTSIALQNSETGNVHRYQIDSPDELGNLPKDGYADAKECWSVIEHAKLEYVAVPILEEFNRNGCDYVDMLALMNMICSYPRPPVNELKGDLNNLLKRINRLHSALLKLDKRIRNVSSEIYELTGVRDESRHVERFRGFLEVGYRLIAARDRTKTRMLVYLSEYTRAGTERAPYFEKLAELLSTRLTEQESRFFDANALGHRYDRYREDFPEDADNLAADARRARVDKQPTSRVLPAFLAGKVKDIS